MKTQRGPGNIDIIMNGSTEGENALASFTDERFMEDFHGGDDYTGK